MCPSNSVSALDRCVCTDANNVWNSSANECQLYCASPFYYDTSSGTCRLCSSGASENQECVCPAGQDYDYKSDKCTNSSVRTAIAIAVPVLVFIVFITTLIICMLKKSSREHTSFQMTYGQTQNLALSAVTGNYV